MPNDNDFEKKQNDQTISKKAVPHTSRGIDKDFDLDDPNSFVNQFKSEHGKDISKQYFSTKESLDINPQLPMTYKEKVRIINRCKLEYDKTKGQLSQTGKAKAYLWGWVVAANETMLLEYTVGEILTLTEAERNDYYLFLNKSQRNKLLHEFRDLVIDKVPDWDQEVVKEYFEAMTMMIQ